MHLSFRPISVMWRESVEFLIMLSRLCRAKPSGYVLNVQLALVVTCALSTTLVQLTTPAVNLTSQTFQVSYSASCVNDFFFHRNRESFLHVYKGVYEGNYSVAGLKWYYCCGFLRVPMGKFISLKISPFEMSASCADIFTTNIDLIFDNKIVVRPCANKYTTTEAADRRVVMYYAANNTVHYRFNFLTTTVSSNITITVRALDQNRRNLLDVFHETNFSGTVNPYGFDGLTDYAVGMRASAWLNPPAGHSVMVSIPHFDIRRTDKRLADYLGFYVQGTKAWELCGQQQIPPAVYQANLTFQFVSLENSRGHTGFMVRFSFHRASELPEKLLTTNLSTAVFNCSVPFYLRFSQHLDCNLETECVQVEDEANCPYSRGACEPGFLNADSKCYKYVKIGNRLMRWYDAAIDCMKQDLKLASFPTFKQEQAFRDNILQYAFTTRHLFFGLRTSDPSLPALYREVWQWHVEIMAFRVPIVGQFMYKPLCAALNRFSMDTMQTDHCALNKHMHYFFCETESPVASNSNIPHQIQLSSTEVGSVFGVKNSTRFIMCSNGHVTHDFLSCDHVTRCGAKLGNMFCVGYRSVKVDMIERNVEVQMFVCNSQTQTIHYTQVCDHQVQCFDSSDEAFCIHHACSEKQCKNQQCVTAGQWCDGMAHCSDGSDEHCPQFMNMSETSSALISGFYVVLLDGHGNYEYVPQGERFPVCPPTHFLCADRQLCLPVYLQCNNVYDCSDREDEDNCDDVTCPGFYRCRGSAVCVHSDHICDGVFHCPEQDDELLCEQSCPDNCLCQGLAFVCPRPFPVQAYSDLRYLDASESGLTPDKLFHNHYLIRLVLSSCRLYTLPVFEFANLKYLVLSSNTLTDVSIRMFLKLSNLIFLDLSRNPIINLFSAERNAFLVKVVSLDLSHTNLRRFENGMVWNLRNLKNLNLSYSTLTSINNGGFSSLIRIESLDLRGTELKDYPVRVLQTLSSLQVIFSDVYKLCCPEVLPMQFNTKNCHTLPDEIASCKDLLRSVIYRLFLWTACSFALIGNPGSFVARLYVQRGKPSNSFNVFIANLNVADFFMGLYLAVIGSADQVYRGTYLWHDDGWKTSAVCQMAGFMSLLSCEMSAFIICFITLDRFLVMRFPFSQLRFRNMSAGILSSLTWAVGITLAAVPLFPLTSDWKFYSQTDICIPLPITRRDFKGHFYSFGVLIVFNSVVFVLIAVGQLFIYTSIRSNTIATDQKNERESKVARRLLTVVMSDFLCWFPIGLLGILSANGVSIPGEVNVAMAIFALPLNSALNPYLYTFNLLMDRRRKASEQRLLSILEAKISGYDKTE